MKYPFPLIKDLLIFSLSEMGIDDESFQLLAEEPSLILEIFPLAGPRLKFKKCYSELNEPKQVLK